MYYTYILESTSTGRLYIGQTKDLYDRIDRHNRNLNKSTKNQGPWKLLYNTIFETRSEAVTLERKLKGFKNPKKVKEWISRSVD
ncbi:MAG: GIY-YIG nuclease family protein [Bacteroidota bacterium]